MTIYFCYKKNKYIFPPINCHVFIFFVDRMNCCSKSELISLAEKVLTDVILSEHKDEHVTIWGKSKLNLSYANDNPSFTISINENDLLSISVTWRFLNTVQIGVDKQIYFEVESNELKNSDWASFIQAMLKYHKGQSIEQ